MTSWKLIVFICLCVLSMCVSEGNDHPHGLHQDHHERHIGKRRAEWQKRFGKDAIGLADNTMKESELYSLLLLLKSISFMVESHAPWGNPDNENKIKTTQ